MAFGNNNNYGGNSKKVYDKTYYSRLHFKNTESNLVLGINFSAGMLIVKLSELDANNQYNDLIKCFLTGLKARIVLEEYHKFTDDFNNGKLKDGAAYGITTGMSDIVTIFSFCVVDGSKAIAIGKINGSGQIQEMHKFKFNDNYHYGLEWKDLDNMVVEKKYYADIEIDAFADTLKGFVENYGGSQAYVGFDLGKYDYRHIDNNINEVMKKLGIQIPSNVNNYGRKSGNSYFDNNNSSNERGTSNSIDVDDIQNSLEGDE